MFLLVLIGGTLFVRLLAFFMRNAGAVAHAVVGLIFGAGIGIWGFCIFPEGTNGEVGLMPLMDMFTRWAMLGWGISFTLISVGSGSDCYWSESFRINDISFGQTVTLALIFKIFFVILIAAVVILGVDMLHSIIGLNDFPPILTYIGYGLFHLITFIRVIKNRD